MGTAECPFRSAPWNTKRTYECKGDDRLAIDPWTKDVYGRRCAFVVTLFGNDFKYCVDAAVLGHSIYATGTQHKMILLRTIDVDEDWLQVLRAVGWEVRECTHLECKDLYNGSYNNRFAGTFTKLHAVRLVEFYKVLMLDADMIIRQNVDHLFNRACPAALRRDAGGNTADGAHIYGSRINAGVVLLKPCTVEYFKMLDDLRTPHSKEDKTGMPEQDFLGRWYQGQWLNLDVKFNYQPHQLGYLARDKDLLKCKRMWTDYENEVQIVHFSALPKPRDLICCYEYHGMNQQTFLFEKLLPKYMELFGKQRSGHSAKVEEFRELIEFLPFALKVRDDTIKSGDDWFRVYRRMTESLKRQDWRTCSGKVCQYNEVLETSLRRKDDAFVTVASTQSRREITSSAADNHKVCLAVANGDQQLAEGLYAYISPQLMNDVGSVDSHKHKGSSKRTENAIGGPPSKRSK